VKPLKFIANPALGVGYDAADLLAAGAKAGHLPPLELVQMPAIGPRVASDERPRGIPSGGHHQALVARLQVELENRGLMPDAVDGWRRRDSGDLVTVSVSELAADIWFELLDDDGIPRGHVTDVLDVIARRMREVRRAELVGRLTGHRATVEGRAALQAWVKAVTGREDSSDVRVMAHWLWLVKRMATGRRTDHDMMPIVYGPQGSGKSTATERLVAPLEELCMTIGASTLTDERRFRPLGICLAGRWEEMQGAGRAEIEALKHTVTAPVLNYRELSTHHTVVLRRTCSFIGTSNNTVDTMINDTTGARRFFQLTTPAKCDHEAINAIDPLLVWQAVSEDQPAPIIEVLDAVRVAQADLVHRDAVSMWLEAESWGERTIMPVDSPSPYSIPAYRHGRGETFEHLAARFKHWCQGVGQSGIGVKEFAKRLKQERLHRHRPSAEPGRTRDWLYLRPDDPANPHATAIPADAPGTPAASESEVPRGIRMASDPHPDEDRFGDGSYAFDRDDPPT
jgi:hypothetical protein